MIRYTLIPPTYEARDLEGDYYPTIGCPKWDFTARVSSLTGTFDMRLETSPTADSETWTTLHDFGTINAEGTIVVTTRGTDDAGDTEISALTPDQRYMRIVVENLSAGGSYALEVVAEAIVLDEEDDQDLALLHPEVRKWTELTTALAKSRELLRAYLGGLRSWDGYLEAVADDPDFYNSLRMAVALQTNWIAAKERSKEKEKGPAKPMDPAAEVILREYRGSSLRWRGR